MTRSTDAVGIFPNEAAIVRLVGALLLEESDAWASQHACHMTQEGGTSFSDNPTIDIAPADARTLAPPEITRSPTSHTIPQDTTPGRGDRLRA